MANKQTCKKGDRVWVEIPTENDVPHKRPALILSVMQDSIVFNRDKCIAIRYLDKEGMEAYQCIHPNWVVGTIDEE